MKIKNLVLYHDVVIDFLGNRQPFGRCVSKSIELAKKNGIPRWVVSNSWPYLFDELTQEFKQEAKKKGDRALETSSEDTARQTLDQFQTETGSLSCYGYSTERLFKSGDPYRLLFLRAADRLGEGTVILSRDKTLLSQDSRVMKPEKFLERFESFSNSENSLPFVDLMRQQHKILPILEKNFNAVMQHGNFIMGREVEELEKRLAQYVGVKHCLSVSSGTDALLIAMMALELRPEDEIITTPFTFIATGEMIALLGAKPIFVDIDPKTYNISPSLIEKAISKKTKAIMPVSLYGQCADFDSVNKIGKMFGIPVIEDGAQSFGATYKNRKSCGLSEIGCTSFFPSKPLGCYGDGGACFTNDDNLASKMKFIRVHGQDKRYHHPVIGINGRLDTLQTAVLLAKLEIFEDEIAARERIGKDYSEMLRNVVETPMIEPFNRSVYAQYTIQVDDRESAIEKLKSLGIPTAVHYPIPLHLQPAFGYLQLPEGSFPVSEQAAKRVLSLPMHPFLKNGEMLRIVDAIHKAVKR